MFKSLKSTEALQHAVEIADAQAEAPRSADEIAWARRVVSNWLRTHEDETSPRLMRAAFVLEDADRANYPLS